MQTRIRTKKNQFAIIKKLKIKFQRNTMNGQYLGDLRSNEHRYKQTNHKSKFKVMRRRKTLMAELRHRRAMERTSQNRPVLTGVKKSTNTKKTIIVNDVSEISRYIS